jgi:mono/diheme cytochrome c family protein
MKQGEKVEGTFRVPASLSNGTRSVPSTLVVTILVSGLILAGLWGCGKEDKGPGPVNVGPNPDTKGRGQEMPAQFAAARKIFDMNCAKCHTTNPNDKGFAGFPGGDKGFKPPQHKFPGGFKGTMGKAPNLAKVGADPKHSRDWLIAYIRDPKSQNPMSRMPKFEGKIDESSLGELADYLGSLK